MNSIASSCGSQKSVVLSAKLTRHACLHRLTAPGHELNALSVGGGGHLAVAGGQGELLFWDRRTRQQLSLFEDTHAEAVTQVSLLHTRESQYCHVAPETGRKLLVTTSPGNRQKLRM